MSSLGFTSFHGLPCGNRHDQRLAVMAILLNPIQTDRIWNIAQKGLFQSLGQNTISIMCFK
jgi:hypothetical protein